MAQEKALHLIFLTLLKVLPGKASEQPSFMRRLKMIQPPSGVMLKEVYLLFGRFDGALIFEAPDAKTAMNFVLKVAAPGIYKTETLAGLRAEEF
jgi:uncharacterized protein with GYD domain